MMRRHRPRRRPAAWKLVALALAQVLVLATAVSAAGLRLVSAPLDADMYTLLVIGSDLGPPRAGHATRGRADALHLLVVSPDHRYVSILDFPRDAYVPVTGIGRTKINAGLTRGPDNMVATVENLTGIHIDDWIVTGFQGFVRAIDEIDGVTIDVEQRLYDPRGSSSNLQPGVQNLTGWSALTYARDRHSRPDGDFGRSAAQGRILRSLHGKIRGLNPSPGTLMELLSLLRRHTSTSMPAHRMIRLAALALEIPPENVGQVMVDGYPGWAGRASVVRLTDAAYATFADVRSDGVLDRLKR